MGLFSSSPPLDNEIQAFVSPLWTESEVGRRDYKAGLSKVADSQETIRSAMQPGEFLNLIVPCIANNTGYYGLCVVTSERLMQIKGRRVEKQFKKADLADVKQMAHPSGHFLVQLISRKAAPFAAFAGQQSPGGTKFWEGTIQSPISTEDLLDHLVMIAQS